MVTPEANPDIKRHLSNVVREEQAAKIEKDRIALDMETIYEVMEDGPYFTVGEEFYSIIPQPVVPPVSGYVSSVDIDAGIVEVCDRFPEPRPQKGRRWYQSR